MQIVILMGVQASGKSMFCKQHLYASHIRINLDMLKTRHREKRLLQTCLEIGQSLVIDNTNPTREDRRRYIEPAKEAGFHVEGYYFESKIEICKQRNECRPESQRVPLPGVLGTYGRLELPGYDEGFDRLYFVKINENGEFIVEEWDNEI